MNVAIVGCGISGLSTGFFLKSKGINVELFEAKQRVGGYAGSIVENGITVEFGPNGFLNNEPITFKLIEALNIKNKIIYSSSSSKKRYIFFNNKLYKIPSNPKEFLGSDLLSLKGKIRLLMEPLTSRSKLTPETSVYEFFADHLGSEVADRVVTPFVIGVFGGDAKKLSMSECFPKILSKRNVSKSLFISTIKSRKGLRKKTKLFSFQGGSQTFVNALIRNLENEIHLGCKVREIHSVADGKWKLRITDNLDQNFQSKVFDHIVFSVNPLQLSKIFGLKIPSQLKAGIEKFPCVNLISLSLGFNSKVPFKGFGTLIHPNENLNILGFLHPGDIFKGHVSKSKDLLTIMISYEKAEALGQENLLTFVLKDLEKIIGPLPKVEDVWQFNHVPGIPQYNIDVIDLIKTLNGSISSHKGLHLNSNFYGGVSVNDCIRKSFELCSEILS